MSDLLRTPLHERHLAAGAKMVPFAGYEMPVQYSGLVEEHRTVRQAAGLFDVSHMGEFFFDGRQAAACLDDLTPSRISALEVGRAAYSALTTEKGTFIDDILVYRLGEQRFLVVVNAANLDKDRRWIEEHIRRFDVRFEDRSQHFALLALQGPRARAILSRLAEGFDALAVKYYRVVEGSVAGQRVIAARTGYTGEMGWEIFAEPVAAEVLWDALLEAGAADGLRPAGLGARDSLRLEAALPLYGNDIDEQTTVLEAGLEFIVDWDKSEFIGRQALCAQKEQGPARRRAGLEIIGRGIARQGHPVVCDTEVVGRITSGSWSPTLQKAIAMAYLPVDLAVTGTDILVEVRGRQLPARVVDMPFYRRAKKKRSPAS
ncbi:MAG TPA: glycine cleavage system aminomethyltransferase GcvT [Acidobacteria bacterium]|nr:glycine cleavage system aminomethyltransferase GcvT [Acidobacteriota bacterium]